MINTVNWDAVVETAFPISANVDVESLARLLVWRSDIHHGSQIGAIDSEMVRIPERLNFRPVTTDQLSDELRGPYGALSTRHQDGRVRQSGVKMLLENSPRWAPVYVFALIGDYVIEVVEELRSELDRCYKDRTVRQNYLSLAAQNRTIIHLARQRAISYWNEYYRAATGNFDAMPSAAILRMIEQSD